MALQTLPTVRTLWGSIRSMLQAMFAELYNNYPVSGLTFSGQFNLSSSFESYYNAYTTNVAVTPTVAATPLVGAMARVVFNAGASASLVATNLGTLRPGSDTFTVSKLNEIIVFSLPEGLEYAIKVLN